MDRLCNLCCYSHGLGQHCKDRLHLWQLLTFVAPLLLALLAAGYKEAHKTSSASVVTPLHAMIPIEGQGAHKTGWVPLLVA